MKSEWISVKDNLPEREQFVLANVTGNWHNIIINQYCGQEYWTDGTINAWMPLPESYKESKAVKQKKIREDLTEMYCSLEKSICILGKILEYSSSPVCSSIKCARIAMRILEHLSTSSEELAETIANMWNE